MWVFLGVLQHLAIGGIDTHVTSHALDLDVEGMAQARTALFLFEMLVGYSVTRQCPLLDLT